MRFDPAEPYCSTCRTALMVYTDAAGDVVEIVHARVDKTDHRPLPVALKDLPNPLQFCDFCSTEGPQWMIKTTKALFIDTAENRVDNLGTTWLACDTCFVLINNRDTEGMLTRAIATFAQKAPPEGIRALLEPVYVHLLEEMGEVEPNPKGPK